MKKSVLWGMKGLLGCAAVGYLVHMIEVDALWTALKRVDPFWIAVAGGLAPLVVLLDAVVWRRLLTPVLPNASSASVLRAVLRGSALGLVTPARLGEFAGRALSFPEADPWTLSATVFAQRVIDMAICAGLGLAALGMALHAGWLPTRPLWLGLTASVAATCGMLLWSITHPRQTSHLIRRLAPNFGGLHRRIKFLEQIAPRTGRRVLQTALLRQSLFCAQFASLVLAFGPVVALLDLAAGILLVFLAKFLMPSVTLLDLGVREGAAVFFLGAVGVGPAAAFNAALLLFVLTGVLPALAGLPYALQLRLNPSAAVSSSSA